MKHNRIVAVIPVGHLATAKSRLRPALSPLERRALVRWMASRVLAAVKGSERISAVAVVSPDPRVLDLSLRMGAVPIAQHQGDLNAGLELGREWATAYGASGLLVLLGDLPFLTSDDVSDFTRLAETESTNAPLVGLAPDRHERGTNGLLLRPVDALPFAFGVESLARHEASARARGITPLRFYTRGLQHDVDTPADVNDIAAWFTDEDTPLHLVKTECKPA